MVMYSVIIFSVSGLNTLFVRVRVVSLSGLCPVRVVYLSGLCPCPGCVCPVCVLSRLRPVRVVSCPGYAPVRVVSVRVVSVRVASCPGCVCPGYVVAPVPRRADGCSAVTSQKWSENDPKMAVFDP